MSASRPGLAAQMNKAEKMATVPGSPDALKHGRLCGDLNNPDGTGVGTIGQDGKPVVYARIECPLHRHLVPEVL